MLKLVVFIQCDDCNRPFQLSRVSDCTTSALNFNSAALTASLNEFYWTTGSQKKYHFCQDCSSRIVDMEEQSEH